MAEFMTLKVSKPTLRSETQFIFTTDKWQKLQCTAMKHNDEEIPVFIEGKLYNIHFTYSQLLRCLIPHLMAAEGEYMGFIGPQLRDGEIQVTREVFDKFFWIQLWQHGTSTAGDPVVWHDQVQNLNCIEHKLKEGWLLTKPERKEKAQ
jgi:hypothetical protein